MKVLFVTPYFMPAHHYGGPIESVYRLCQNVAQLGYDVRVLTTNANGLGRVLDVETTRDVAVAAGFDVRYTSRVMRHAVAPGLLWRMLTDVRRADLVHLTAVYSFTTIPTLLACRMLGRPLVWSPRGSLQRWSGSRRVAAKHLWNRICRSLAPRTTVLHLTSDPEAAESRCEMPGMATVTIPNGVRIPPSIQRITTDGPLRLGYLGRLDAKKGLENLLDAMAVLKGAASVITLTIAGDGHRAYVRTLRDRVAHLGLATKITFVGEVRGATKRRFFQTTDLLVSPSYTENFAIVVAEALAHGVPVIASRGTPWQKIEDRRCGLWVDNSPASLAAAIEQIRALDLPAMGARGRAWMAAEFTWPAIARDMCNTYFSLLQRRPLFGRESDARIGAQVPALRAEAHSTAAESNLID